MSGVAWDRVAARIAHAAEVAVAEGRPGTTGIELELNVVDGALRPVQWVGRGPERRSLAEVLLAERIPEWARRRFQREVFHWMVEAATAPHHDLRATALASWLLEAVVLDTVHEAGLALGGRLLAMPGPLLAPVRVDETSIPPGFNLARRRYLARCVARWGERLATAGIHTNHSLPEPLVEWEYVHLPAAERRGLDLERFRSELMVRATRLVRPWCPVFMAVSASSPFSWEEVDGEPQVVLTPHDSNRLLTFPNPAEIDCAELYASHAHYLRISYRLIEEGHRIGGNNWTPVRARSGVEPVLRNLETTSEQLAELYRRGLYAPDEVNGLEEAERLLTLENLRARIDLPLSRIEVRTDEGWEPPELAVARLALKQLLLYRIAADPEHGAGYRYTAEDVARARRNERRAAERGLDASLEHPFAGRECTVRELLGELLGEVRPLALELGWLRWLEPLEAMAAGAPNPAGALRREILERLGNDARTTLLGNVVVPHELVVELAERRARTLARAIAAAPAPGELPAADAEALVPLLEGLERWSGDVPGLPVAVAAPAAEVVVAGSDDITRQVVALAAELIRIPSVTNCPRERPDEVLRCARRIAGLLDAAGAEVRLLDDGPYPAVVAGFPGTAARVALSGHFDVVEPEPGTRQLVPRVEGDYLWGRGAADMKTVVATWIVWMRHALAAGPPYPPLRLLLVGNEENGEAEPWGTPHLLAELHRREAWEPELMVVGERTGERGDELVGKVCLANRGVVRLRLVASGRRAHTGTGEPAADLVARLAEGLSAARAVLGRRLTLASFDGWQTALRFPFLSAGEPGVYNITPDRGELGIEIRPIPEDDAAAAVAALEEAVRGLGLEVAVDVLEGGVACPPDVPALAELLAAIEEVRGAPAEIGRKLAGTSARFAPGGRAVVWGQSGIGPHSREERHFIPSIRPHLEILDAFARRLASRSQSR